MRGALTYRNDSLFSSSSPMGEDVVLTEATTVTFTEEAGAELFSGIPLPYTLRGDDWVTGVLLLCFLVSSYIFAHSKKLLVQQVKDFFHHKERASIFVANTANDIKYQLFLILQTCIFLAICSFDYFDERFALLERSTEPPQVILGMFVLILLIYYLVKWVVYNVVGWIFFDKSTLGRFFEAYFMLITYLGFGLFPLTLLIVYFDLPVNYLIVFGTGMVIFAKLLIFYKWFKFFFDQFYGIFLLIVYFCALEIIPCFILYRVMGSINYMLEIKI